MNFHANLCNYGSDFSLEELSSCLHQELKQSILFYLTVGEIHCMTFLRQWMALLVCSYESARMKHDMVILGGAGVGWVGGRSVGKNNQKTPKTNSPKPP